MSKLTSGWEALQQHFRQVVETRQRQSRFSYHSGGSEVVSPGENIADHWEQAVETAIVRLSLLNFSYDVSEPGIRIEGKSDAVTYLEEEWIPQAGIIAGERHKPIDPLIPMTPMQRWGRGGLMLEHVRADPEDPSSVITGVNPVRPETGKFVTLKDKDIIVEPEDLETDALDSDDVLMTKRDEPAAFIQWHPDALRSNQDRNSVGLSINDFTRTVFSPGIGGGPMSGVWGRPITETIADDVAGFKNIRSGLERAIVTKGWGLWDISFGREVLEYEEDGKQVTEIIEWGEDEHDDYVTDVERWDPGGVMTHDGEIELQRLDSDVPDLIDELEFYVSNITAALPTPKFVIGFEENINQFVTEAQDARYQLLVSQERNDLGSFFTELFTTVVEQNTSYSASDLEVKLEPPEEESPILSLTNEEIEKIATWMGALAEASGSMDPAMLIDEAVIRELILQLPENSGADIDEDQVDSSDPEVQEQIEELKQIMAEREEDGQDDGDQPPEQLPADD